MTLSGNKQPVIQNKLEQEVRQKLKNWQTKATLQVNKKETMTKPFYVKQGNN
jgi:hypothetical protein